MRIRLTFSEFNFEHLKTENPCLPLTTTIELVPNDEPTVNAVFRINIPGCLFLPFEAGRDGMAGQLREPKCFRFRGTRTLPQTIVGPDEFKAHMEQQLRANRQVLRWTRRVANAVRKAVDNPKALSKIREWEAKNDPLIVWQPNNPSEDS